MPPTIKDPKIVARQAKWDATITARLPNLLETLLDCEVFGLTNGRGLPPKQYGIYLFTEGGVARYIGRVGWTDRSRAAGKKFSNFQTRLRGHTRPRHSEGTYAYKRTCDSFKKRKLPLQATRAKNCEHPDFMEEFRRQCDRVKHMGFQVVEINDDKLAAVFEIYAANALGLRQSFAVS